MATYTIVKRHKRKKLLMALAFGYCPVEFRDRSLEFFFGYRQFDYEDFRQAIS